MLTVAVLGTVEVRRDDEVLPVPTGKTTEVLVRLALDAGRPVRAEQLIEDLWHDAAGTGRNTLQSKVSQLRRALGDPGLVTATSGGYCLNLDPTQVDALEVLRAAESVAAARRAGTEATAVDRATAALALFRGDVLVDAGDGEWVQPHRTRLEEVRFGLLEDRLAARVALGPGPDVIAELEGLVGQYPLREGLWSSLISAQYLAGRQADALASYTRVRRILADELGVDPGPGLRRLEEQILQQSEGLEGDHDRLADRRGNLPALTSDLVGRVDELVTLRGLLAAHRLVTVVGPAGVGKTRTAIELGRALEVPGGVWLVRLDGVDASSSLGRVVAETLGVTGGEAQLVEWFAGAETVLVLDNCEHVVAEAAALVERLVDGAPSVRVLTTSQVPLGVDGEEVLVLAPLTLAESTALFTGRAARFRRTSSPEETDGSVEEVCRALDGLPLAIELAAARTRSLSVPEIARRLEDRFSLLRDPTSRAGERRSGLAGAIGWSYELLFPDDQRGLWAMATFAGGAPLAAAEHVLEALGVPTESALDVVERLVDRSLVTVESGPGGAVRYRLLDSIRAFAAARLQEAGLTDVAGAAHAAWYAAEAERCAAVVRGPGQGDCVAFVRAERANVDAALAWCADHDLALGARTALGFGWTWVVLGDGVTGAARVRAALAPAAGTTPPEESVAGLLLAGWLEASAGDVDLAETDLAAADEMAGRLTDDRLVADVQRHRAFLRIQQGRPDDVLRDAGDSIEQYRRLGLAWETAAGLLLAAYGWIMRGATADATRAAEEAATLLTPDGDPWGLVHARGMLGAIAQAEHRFDDAARSLAEAAEQSERLGFLGQAALHLTRWGRVEQQRGDLDAAGSILDRAILAAQRAGDHRIAGTARITLARVSRQRGDDVRAVALLEQAEEWYRTAGGDGELLTRCLLAQLAVDGDPVSATGLLTGLLAEARAAGDPESELAALDGLAHAAAVEGDLDRASELLGSADALHAQVAHLVTDADRVDARVARELLADPQRRTTRR